MNSASCNVLNIENTQDDLVEISNDYSHTIQFAPSFSKESNLYYSSIIFKLRVTFDTSYSFWQSGSSPPSYSKLNVSILALGNI